MVKYCPKCGTPNDDNALFCTMCGYQFSQSQETIPSNQQFPTFQPPISKKSRKNMWIIVGAIVVVLIMIIAIIAAISLSPSNKTPIINVTAVDLTIQYTGATSGYLGPLSQSLPGFTTNAGTKYVYSITFISSVSSISHSINLIYANTSGFSILSTSPNLPFNFSPGSTFKITITLDVPSSRYTGVLNLIVSTSENNKPVAISVIVTVNSTSTQFLITSGNISISSISPLSIAIQPPSGSPVTLTLNNMSTPATQPPDYYIEVYSVSGPNYLSPGDCISISQGTNLKGLNGTPLTSGTTVEFSYLGNVLWKFTV